MQVKDRIKLHRGEKCREVEALFDTGARSTFVSDRLAKELGYEPTEPYEIPLAVRGRYAKVVGDLTAVFEVDGCKLPRYTARVVEELKEDVIVGASLMEEFGIRLDLELGKARLRSKPPELPLI